MVVSAWALPILDKLGGQDNASAWFKFTVIFGAVSAVIFILSAMSVKNVDVYDPAAKNAKTEKKGFSLKETFSVITKNKALLCVLIAYGTDMFAFQISNSLRMYFFKYNMGGRTDLITYIGYASTFVGFALVAFIQPFVKKTGKYAISAVMFTYIAITFTWTINNMLSRSAVLDSANYAQMTLGINGTALVNSTFTFVNKCCQAFSMFFSGIILSATGYNKDAVEQTPGCLKAILLLCTVGPIIAYVFSIAAMYFYPLTRKGEVEMQEKLDKMSFVNLEDDLIL